MDEKEICGRFEAALDAFFENEAELLELDVHERTVAGYLAHRYLAPQFPNHRVDADYNKVGLAREPKRLELPKECRGGGYRIVVPDIIVHHRGTNDQNLLVVEIKMETNNIPRMCDEIKLVGYREQLQYRVGVLLDLPAGNGASDRPPALQWFR
jgi:hypothetical protein